MSKNTSNESQGADGSWFLEAVGASPKTPTPSEVVAGLDADNTQPDLEPIDPAASVPTPAPVEPEPSVEQTPAATVEVATFDGNPGTSTSSFAPVPPLPPPPTDLETEPTVDADPSETQPAEPVEVEQVEDEQHDELSHALKSRRNFRWPVVIVLFLLIAAVGVAAYWLPKAAEQDALAVRQDYYDASSAVRVFLPEAQAGLDAITNPASSSGQIAGAIPVVSELDSRAFALETTAAEPLPSPPPLVPTGSIDALVPLQTTGLILGSETRNVARRMGVAYVYRTSIPLLLDPGTLPAKATTQEVNEISVMLAGSLADDAGIVADLPADPVLDNVKTAASAAIDFYGRWQDDYLTALTGEDEAAAKALISELDETRAALNETNTESLLVFRTEVDGIIVSLAGELETYMTEITQP